MANIHHSFPVNANESGNFPYPYVCSLSTLVRSAIKVMNAQATIQNIVEGVIKEIMQTEGVADSLKSPLLGKLRSARQCDIRAEAAGPIIFKVFVAWDQENQRWHVYVEAGEEVTWEKNFKPPDAGLN